MSLTRTLSDGTPYVSPSQVKQVNGCGARYEWTYVMGNDHPESYDLHFGRLVHELVEAWALDRASADDPHAHAVAYARDEIPDELIMEERGPEANAYERVADRAVDLLDTLIEHAEEQDWTVLDAEKETIHRRDDEPAVRGFLDLILEGDDGGVVIVDVKTTKRSPSYGQARERDAYQVVTYADAEESTGTTVEECRVVYLVRNKTPKIVDAPVTLSEEAVHWARSVTQGGVEKIQRGDYAPNPFGAGFLCAPDKCGRWSTCPGAARWREDDEDGGA